jgi:hypothetical protein
LWLVSRASSWLLQRYALLASRPSIAIPILPFLSFSAGLGVKAVIARSFSFIYGRNQPSLGLLGITMTDDDFYATALDGTDIEIDFPKRKILVGGKEFGFKMADMEYRLTTNKGLSESYKKFGWAIWEKMTEKRVGMGENVPKEVPKEESGEEIGGVDARLKW